MAAFLGLILTLSLVAPVWSAGFELRYDSLPSAQQMVFHADITHTDVTDSVAEGDTFTLDGPVLVQNTLGTDLRATYYFAPPVDELIDPSEPFQVVLGARVIAEEDLIDASDTWPVLSVTINTDEEGVGFGLRTDKIQLFNDGSTFPFPSIAVDWDNTEFHDYVLDFHPGMGFELFVDGVSAVSGAFMVPPTQYANTMLWGDAWYRSNGHAEISRLSLVQPPSQPTAVRAATWAQAKRR